MNGEFPYVRLHLDCEAYLDCKRITYRHQIKYLTGITRGTGTLNPILLSVDARVVSSRITPITITTDNSL